jgi:hypothetical protein
MNSKQENKVSMYNKVRAFFTTNLISYATYPALAGNVTSFNALIDAILADEGIASEDRTGYADQKAAYRADITARAIEAASALLALSTMNSDLVMRKKVNFSESTLKSMRDTQALVVCNNIKQLLTDNAADLKAYGIKPAFITAYNSSLDIYNKSIEMTGEIKSVKVSTGKSVDRLIAQTDKLLNDIIDPIMLASRSGQLTLFNQYQNVRSIDDYASGRSTPDFSVTLNPNSFQVVTTIPYEKTRSFRVKNKGKNTINWGLSSDPNAFTNTVEVLTGGNISTKLSATLGILGNVLLFQNTTAGPIDIDVSIIN